MLHCGSLACLSCIGFIRTLSLSHVRPEYPQQHGAVDVERFRMYFLGLISSGQVLYTAEEGDVCDATSGPVLEERPTPLPFLDGMRGSKGERERRHVPTVAERAAVAGGGRGRKGSPKYAMGGSTLGDGVPPGNKKVQRTAVGAASTTPRAILEASARAPPWGATGQK